MKRPSQMRDSRGRFTTAKPKAPSLDPALVRSLGAHRRPEILMMVEHEVIVLAIIHPKATPDPDE